MADNQAVSAKADIGTGTREMYSYSEKWNIGDDIRKE